jgi:hypothetical protein
VAQDTASDLAVSLSECLATILVIAWLWTWQLELYCMVTARVTCSALAGSWCSSGYSQLLDESSFCTVLSGLGNALLIEW